MQTSKEPKATIPLSPPPSPPQTSKEPKATIPLSDVNVCLAPAKMHQDNGMQLSYITEGSTRHIYVYHESGYDIINWYMAIRSAKLNRLMVAYPSSKEDEVSGALGG